MDFSELLAEDGQGRGEKTVDFANLVPSKIYTVEELRRPQSVADIGRESSALYHTFGLDTLRKKNLQLISERTIVYAVGNAVVFEDLDTKIKKYLLGLDEGGVGCVAVHPCRKIFAVGGRGYQPKIYIYTYPDMKVSFQYLAIYLKRQMKSLTLTNTLASSHCADYQCLIRRC